MQTSDTPALDPGMSDTIAAISTPPGRGGIGIVRLSGPQARAIAEPLLRVRGEWEANRARLGAVVVEAGNATGVSNTSAIPNGVLDEAVVTFFAAPRSYTGEDVVEIAAHGAPVLLDALLRACVTGGARLAEPGEFTQRAFLAGRLDLTQAEAVEELIASTTLEQARTAARQLGGGIARQIRPVKEELIALIAAMEAGIDFAEDDLEVMPEAEILRRIEAVWEPLSAIEASFAYGRVLREGFKLAIVGRPNAGKSSLFNRLVRRERAIVTAQPGTTRDTVTERLDFGGIPVELIDTAGLRDSADEAEAMGIARSREAMAEADLVLLVVPAREELDVEDRAVMQSFAERKLIVVRNKIDLLAAERAGAQSSASTLHVSGSSHGMPGFAVVGTSAVTGEGLDALRAAVLEVLRAVPVEADTAPLTNLRQHQAVVAAMAALRTAAASAMQRVPHEMVLLDLHEALAALDGLTGKTHTEEILRLIFSRFCIGK
jgi:tRNA modification GTPase